jgi:hypothetical protein
MCRPWRFYHNKNALKSIRLYSHHRVTPSPPALADPLRMQVQITIQGDAMHLDFSGNPS